MLVIGPVMISAKECAGIPKRLSRNFNKDEYLINQIEQINTQFCTSTDYKKLKFERSYGLGGRGRGEALLSEFVCLVVDIFSILTKNIS